MTFIVILQDFLLYLGLVFNFKNHNSSEHNFEHPKISVLIAARNEAKFLPHCLQSLENLKYDIDKIEFILANDESIDETESIIKAWVSRANNRRYLNITTQTTKTMNGKANALHQMATLAQGEYFLFTDADCEVPAYWANDMVASAVNSKSDLVTGITKVKPTDWYASMQAIDWWLTLGMVKVASDAGVVLTSMGNNMLISRNAYRAIGGFASLPLTVTEDFEIAKAVKQLKFKAVHQVSSENLIFTHAQETLVELLAQRKRWLKGVMGLPFYWKIMLGLQAMFFPFILILFSINPGLAAALWMAKILTQSLFIKDFARSTGTIVLPYFLITFELYYIFVSWSTILYYFWPAKVKWKGRQYE
ncbi:glycosyltransferase [Anditalea andensis]|uniref:glycosyltransferase n=1 Tax=Anditalea andensis TaxID=1048983 RepID=UPI0013DECF0D|nr:glycosyltransferase [Anditalea andensis]